MTNWAIALVSAFGGALFALAISEGWKWFHSPRLSIDFEEMNGHKPYILDCFLQSGGIPVKTSMAKFIRANVRNTGRSPAMNCEAKMVISEAGKAEVSTILIHWARRDPDVYKKLDQIYAPVHVNRSDREPLDLLMLHYIAEDPALPGNTLTSVSPRAYNFKRNVIYNISVTVYARNTVSKPFVFKLSWDGTLAGFNKAVQRIEKSKDV